MKIAEQQRTQLPHGLMLELLSWAMLLTIGWWWTLTAVGPDVKAAIVFVSALSLLSGLRIFLGHGSGTITATGLFGLSTAMFVGFSGLLLVAGPVPRAGWENLALACAAGLTAQVATGALAWRPSHSYEREPFWGDDRTTRWVTWVGATALLLAVLAHLASPALHAFTPDAAFTASCILAAGLMLRPNYRVLSVSSLVVVGCIVLFTEFFHSGTGRLHIVALACAIAILFSARFPVRRVKVFIVSAVPVALAWMALDRLALEESLGATAGDGRTGLESMIAPLNIFSLLLESLQEGRFSPGLGYNLLSVPALFIPESVWPTQPPALGYELVQFDDPARYGDGIFSTVATFAGEGFFNFGWLGLPLVIVFAAVALRLLDTQLQRQLAVADRSLVQFLGLVLFAMLCGAVADYTWSGVHTYAARMIRRLPIFLIALVLAWLSERLQERARPEHVGPARSVDRISGG